MEASSPSNSEARNIVAACNFRGEQTTIWMRHGNVAMPRCCACCLTEENLLDEPLALAGRADRIPFPICPTCRHHSKIDSVAIGVSLLIGVVGPPLIYWLLVGTGFFGRLRGLGLLLVLYLVAALLLTGAVYTAISRWFTPSTGDCADTSWPVEERPSIEIGNVVGEKNERTDERDQRLFVAEVTKQLGPGHIALQFRNHEFARRFLAANAAADEPIRKIEKAL